MDWNWFLFSFEGRINRAKIWFAAFIWFATVFSFMTLFLFAVAGILRAAGSDFHMVSIKTMHPAFYLLGVPLLVIGVWLFAATVIKRLHDRDKSAWWLVPFFIAPSLFDKLGDRLDDPVLPLVVSAIGFGLSLWCFVELFCLRGTKGPNRFGSDPLAPGVTGLPWDQQSALVQDESRVCTHKTRRATRPLFPQKRTFYSAICMSALCQKRSHGVIAAR